LAEAVGKEKGMPHVTSWERMAEERGRLTALLTGLKRMLDLRFGKDGLAFLQSLEQYLEHHIDPDLVERLLDVAARRDSTLVEVRHLLPET